jgi:ribosomal protein S18 acetylase RimI-like enzyme
MSHIVELLPDQREPGLRLALKDLDEAQYRVQTEALFDAEIAPLPTRVRVWGMYRDGLLTGSVLAQVQPGRSALIWPPRTGEGEPPQSADELLWTALRAMSQTDLCIVQALLPTDAGRDADLLRAAGFRHVSDLLYLVCLDNEFPTAPPTFGLEFLPVESKTELGFAALVEATYEGTLDCPAVNGLRTIEDVLLGYRATGKYDPQGWLFVRRQGDDVGCLIVSDYPQFETRELIYMGLLPAARRQGHGLTIVRHALWQAATARRQRLVLAVDAANEPALRMYAAAGFQAWDRKSVFVLATAAERAAHRDAGALQPGETAVSSLFSR